MSVGIPSLLGFDSLSMYQHSEMGPALVPLSAWDSALKFRMVDCKTASNQRAVRT